ncbi:uncharacterized protein SPPG_05886 [Spizellomyces punctatus DAOM BR117]|uniref:Uncharacterized protein n=1 Tax=Spizellomyces punctatus (strain DAOM BR117) TaxID=645134 RepID=A0A0L0HDT1_SPIPD|nr:uncharacterized protein SPPG_05886 [Spizellomyces punctatus DAOM BR117]KNC98923.1 hypothetical protein SPPG_05886 [Spizellomyces punctatus DAOM BR117]|eukprot:XP_016606963.1 hypothetical protein SPPG_05886 [Spizellomyces punctatus DAOM BR117]
MSLIAANKRNELSVRSPVKGHLAERGELEFLEDRLRQTCNSITETENEIGSVESAVISLRAQNEGQRSEIERHLSCGLHQRDKRHIDYWLAKYKLEEESLLCQFSVDVNILRLRLKILDSIYGAVEDCDNGDLDEMYGNVIKIFEDLEGDAMQNPDSGSLSIQLEALLDSKTLIQGTSAIATNEQSYLKYHTCQGRPRNTEPQSTEHRRRPPSDVTNEYLTSVSAARFASLEQELYRSETHAAELQRELDELER